MDYTQGERDKDDDEDGDVLSFHETIHTSVGNNDVRSTLHSLCHVFFLSSSWLFHFLHSPSNQKCVRALFTRLTAQVKQKKQTKNGKRLQYTWKEGPRDKLFNSNLTSPLQLSNLFTTSSRHTLSLFVWKHCRPEESVRNNNSTWLSYWQTL